MNLYILTLEEPEVKKLIGVNVKANNLTEVDDVLKEKYPKHKLEGLIVKKIKEKILEELL